MALCDSIAFRSQIFLVNDTVMADDEAHHAAIVIFCWPGHQCESGDHTAINDVIVGASWRAITLCGEDTVLISLVVVALLVLTVKRAQRAGYPHLQAQPSRARSAFRVC